jgi:hypothetical protein
MPCEITLKKIFFCGNHVIKRKENQIREKTLPKNKLKSLYKKEEVKDVGSTMHQRIKCAR